MKKKLRVPFLAAMMASSIMLLSGCQSKQADSTTVATYSGGQVTQASFYKELKQSPTPKPFSLTCLSIARSTKRMENPSAPNQWTILITAIKMNMVKTSLLF